jgi:hypothetical protein
VKGIEGLRKHALRAATVVFGVVAGVAWGGLSPSPVLAAGSTVRAATSLECTIPAGLATYGTTLAVTGRLTDGAGADISASEREIVLWSSPAAEGEPLVWSEVATAAFDPAAGGYARDVTVTASTAYRMEFSGDSTYSPSVSRHSRVICTDIPATIDATPAPALVAYGTTTTVTACLDDANGVDLCAPDRTVTLWRYDYWAAAPTASQVGTATYDAATGMYKAAARLTRNAVLRLQYAGDASHTAASVDETVGCRARMPLLWGPRTSYTSRAFTVRGLLTPRHTGYTRLEVFQLTGGSWVLRRLLLAPNVRAGDMTAFSRPVSLPSAGMWRIRARHLDADHARSYSPWAWVRVTVPPKPKTFYFPVAAPHRFSDTWGAPRSGGRGHEGTDIFARNGAPCVAVVPGRVEIKNGGLAGKSIWLHARDGKTYFYAHLSGWAVRGGWVKAGKVIGYVGETGNATTPHLHFSIWLGGGRWANPYKTLVVADR